MGTPFPQVLVRLRKEQGFATAHFFYESREGKRHLGLSFASYLDIERGKSLPEARRVKAILLALGIPLNWPQARELIRAYCAAWVGEELFAGVVAAPAGKTPEWKLAADAAARALARRTVRLEERQWRTLALAREAHACHLYLANTPGWHEIKTLRRALELDGASAKRGVRALAAAGLVELSGQRVRARYHQEQLQPAEPAPRAAGLYAALYGHEAAWSAGTAPVHGTALTARISRANLERYLGHLDAAVDMASLYGSKDAAAGSALYLAEGHVYELFP